MMTVLTRWLAAPVVLAFAACASAPTPQAPLQAATAAASAAEAVGAKDTPRAKFHLQLALEQIEAAKKLMQAGDNAAARRALERAEADATLAKALAEEQTTIREAHEAHDKLDELRQEAL